MFSVIRRILACVILVALTVLAFASTFDRDLNVCRDEAAEPTGDGATDVREVCEPLGISDGPLAVGLILALVLFVPDLRRLSIPGFVELELKVQEQEHRHSALEHKVSLMSLEVRQATTQQTNIHVLSPSADLETLDRSVRERINAFVGLSDSDAEDV